jgi:glycosyltransferase involved in cell wall biosynthesis
MAGAAGRAGVTHPAESCPVRVLFLVTNFDRGGAEKIVTRLAHALSRTAGKYDVRVAALQGRSGAIADDLSALDIPTHDLGMTWKGDVRVVPRLARLIGRHRVQILFTFMFHPNVLGRLIGRACGVPVRIASERIMAWEGLGRRLVNRWTVRLSTCVVAVSQNVAQYAAREFRIPSGRLVVVANGVDLERFRPGVRLQGREGVVIGSTSRLHAKNNHETLLRAFALLVQGGRSMQLLLVGHGPEAERLGALAKSLGIAERVRFVGEQADVAPWLRQMDVYVQASVAEGMSNSILEAMASALPVVATAVGGTPELVTHGETGILVPARDAMALAEALTQLTDHPALLERLGRAGRDRAAMLFRESLMLERVERLLDACVERHLGRRFSAPVGWVTC